jgi:hypothetical protein
MAAKNKRLIAFETSVEIKAAAAENEEKSVPSFEVVAYTGDAMNLAGWSMPVVVDVRGLSYGKSIIANLDHDRTKRVGHVTAKQKEDGQLVLTGKISAATDAAREVVESAANGFVWQASIEASPDELREVAAGKTVTVNGREFTGPLYVASKSTLKGFAFVSHGADDNTSVSIAAEVAQSKENPMDKKLQAWIESLGFVVADLSEEQVTGLTADYEGRKRDKPRTKLNLGDGIAAKKAEQERVDGITEVALTACERQPFHIDQIKELAETAIEAKWTVDKFRLELLEATMPQAHTVFHAPRGNDRLNARVLEAAVCVAGRLSNVDKMFDDQTLQAAHDRFPHGIGLNQLLLIGAEANGYRANHSSQVTIEAQRAAFGMVAPQSIHATAFSTLSIPNVLAATANKFLREGWDAVDMTPLVISAVRNVRDFKQITTVSLTGHLMFEELGASGEIKHGTLSDLTYTNQADTYAKMLAITRKDIINDDLGALTAVPRRLGRGGALKLNDIFWTVFLNNTAFFTTARLNVNEAVADMTVGGLEATETIFLNQTDPDSKPLGVQPKILLVPTALKAAALALMASERIIDGSSTTKQGDANIYRGRFRVESSPYMSNSSYTGYSAAAWYMLADPAEMPVIEIAALNGNVMPAVETADADFNVLGVQMRGYSDVGVALQEYRGGVRADGGSS